MEKYKRKFEEILNLSKKVGGGNFKGATLQEWLDNHLDYFFNYSKKPLIFEYRSNVLTDNIKTSIGKDNISDISSFLKYKDSGIWVIKSGRLSTKLPYELIQMWFNKNR